MAYQDILYDKRDGIATITINRPKVLNAFRAETVEEMLEAMRDADNDADIGVIVLAGAGDRAFCSGGDNSARSSGSQKDEGYGGRGLVGLPIEELHSAIRDSRKPVIAKVQGYAIGGGNVLATVCDLTIASEKAVFGQVGPLGRSRLGHRFAGAPCRRQAGARDLVPVPPLQRRRGVPDGARQQGRAGG
jgi:2-ketocyclohexanecarboxyl-CoA hydrolase